MKLSLHIDHNMIVRMTGGKNSMRRVPPVMYDGTNLRCYKSTLISASTYKNLAYLSLLTTSNFVVYDLLASKKLHSSNSFSGVTILVSYASSYFSFQGMSLQFCRLLVTLARTNSKSDNLFR